MFYILEFNFLTQCLKANIVL